MGHHRVGLCRHAGRYPAWPLAAHAHDLADTATETGLLAPMQRAERDLVRARLGPAGGDPAASEAFAAAVTRLRQHSIPYHLAHGLLDHAGYLTRLGEADAARAAAGEARDIASTLRCRLLLDRAENITTATIPVQQ